MRKHHYNRSKPKSKRSFPQKKRIPKIKASADPKLKKVFAGIGVPEQKAFKPDPFQLEAIDAIEESDCLVTAPTGAGKTWIAEQAIAGMLEKKAKSWYASPLKALSNAKYTEFSEIFGSDNVGILTGDRKENPEAPIIVGTTEILRNQLYDAMHEGKSLSADFVVLDEAHFLGDEDRGVVWEEVLIYLPIRIPILLLSATVGNAGQIAGWLSKIRSKRCIVVEEDKRPVPLVPLFFHPSGKLLPLVNLHESKQKRKIHKKVNEYLNIKRPPLLSEPRRLPPFGEILSVFRKYRLLPAIFFLKSRADCDGALDLCRENKPEPEQRKKLAKKIQELKERSPHFADHRQLGHLKKYAVGSHHSGQLPTWKLVIEELMCEGLLDAVFATSTVAAGVNFPARSVGFLNSDRYNGQEFLPLSSTEFHQMTGRAGRRGKDRIGFAVAIPGKYMDLRHIAKLINSPPSDVLSQIRINFSMTLNLLLSHEPKEIEALLKKSFATYLINLGHKRIIADLIGYDHKTLWGHFIKHFEFLIQTGFAREDGRLTEDGVWASKLRVDQPLLIAEGFRKGVFPASDPALLAAMMAAFVNEQEYDDIVDDSTMVGSVMTALLKIRKGLQSFAELMIDSGFEARPLYLRPAVSIYAWALGQPWERIRILAEIQEGDLATLILRTADNLRHIKALKDVFPGVADTAGKAIDLILKDPVATF